jgi:methyltransferase family protein
VPSPVDPFERWLEDMERRLLADLTFPQVSSGLRALSSAYVERRHRIDAASVFSGAGKRAAFALFYSPLHFLVVRAIVRALPDALTRVPALVDLGCGIGAGGAAWATAFDTPPRVVGVDRQSWTLGEAARTYRTFDLAARTVRNDMAAVALPRGPAAILAAFSINELPDAARGDLMQRLLRQSASGHRVLIVEPIAGFVAPWWDTWRERVAAIGGRSDEWRFRFELPPVVAKLDRAARLDHREVTARSLWFGGSR